MSGVSLRAFENLLTPCLLLDKNLLRRNCRNMKEGLARRLPGVTLRPHLKTSKCLQVARIAFNPDADVNTIGAAAGHCPVTVSTIHEACYFFENGYKDILYSVGLESRKISVVAPIIRKGALFTGIVDNVAAVEACGRAAALEKDIIVRLLIEIDCGDRRGGVSPTSSDLLDIARTILSTPSLQLVGVITHGGQSYESKGLEEIEKCAEDERIAVTTAAERLKKELGYQCDIVSAGSTPTCTHGKCGTGLTEVRAGVYVFQDLDQSGVGSCTIDDIAISVLATVLGHNKSRGCLIVDAGGLSLSRDSSASRHQKMHPTGLGWVMGAPNLYVAKTSQEHGLIELRHNPTQEAIQEMFAQFPVGSRLRILPNHACFTAAAYDKYNVFEELPDGNVKQEVWSRINGWW